MTKFSFGSKRLPGGIAPRQRRALRPAPRGTVVAVDGPQVVMFAVEVAYRKQGRQQGMSDPIYDRPRSQRFHLTRAVS